MSARPLMCDLCPIGLRGYALGLEEAMRVLHEVKSLVREAALARAFADRLEEWQHLANQPLAATAPAVPPPPPEPAPPPPAPRPRKPAAQAQVHQGPAQYNAKWTPERLDLLRAEYATADQAELLRRVNALPGPPIAGVDSMKVKALTLGLKRAAGRADGGVAKQRAGAANWSEDRRAVARERMQAVNARRLQAQAAAQDEPAAKPEPEAVPAPAQVPTSAAERASGEAIEEWLVATLQQQGVAQTEIDARLVPMSSRVLLNTANAHRRKLGLPEFEVVEGETAAA